MTDKTRERGTRLQTLRRRILKMKPEPRFQKCHFCGKAIDTVFGRTPRVRHFRTKEVIGRACGECGDRLGIDDRGSA